MSLKLFGRYETPARRHLEHFENRIELSMQTCCMLSLVLGKCTHRMTLFTPQLSRSCAYREDLRCHMLTLSAKLVTDRRSLKKQIKESKQHALQTTLDELGDKASASTILRSLRPFIGPSNAKRFFEQPLPMVRNHEGQPCTSPEEAHSTWTTFFAAMEGGHSLSTEQLGAILRRLAGHPDGRNPYSLRP